MFKERYHPRFGNVAGSEADLGNGPRLQKGLQLKASRSFHSACASASSPRAPFDPIYHLGERSISSPLNFRPPPNVPRSPVVGSLSSYRTLMYGMVSVSDNCAKKFFVPLDHILSISFCSTDIGP
ncbi:hypothetical protein ABEB36_001054 [Hypothenemus hampei]|uniref:Uncharacterized protein n=1 Tax=Hypothenemus hampei TaxID=57062 RepID=A0ABD1FF53_HYPHA